jgi:hypothetical protein
MKLQGIETAAKGQNRRQEKWPARAKESVATNDTRIFKTKAVGLKEAGATLNKAKTAMYPDAPPCPTLE